jgi:hypothetical protein
MLFSGMDLYSSFKIQHLALFGIPCRIRKESKSHLKTIVSPFNAMVEIKDGFVRLKPRRPDGFHSFREQLSFYMRRFKDTLMIMQLGKFYELYGRDPEEMLNVEFLMKEIYALTFSIQNLEFNIF